MLQVAATVGLGQMAQDTRLVRRRNGGYAFRGWVPRELREFVAGGRSGQKWISLGTTRACRRLNGLARFAFSSL
ncbi:DUF6538 domain-containing protein [Methylobacterium gossipiicola]|uniref:DUF6538 domain-containing protein n=1 Tax=Methylobacterium gossipiicola TaxID=582675 RepID=UPI003CC79F71